MRELASKLIRYVITGGIAAVVDLGVFALLVQTILSAPPASVVSFCTAALLNYRLTSKYVFSHDATVRGFVRFVAAAVVGLTVNVGVTLAALIYLGLPSVMAKLAGIGTAFFLNFVLNVSMVFRAKRDHSRRDVQTI
jgi:putative flippase GtrA